MARAPPPNGGGTPDDQNGDSNDDNDKKELSEGSGQRPGAPQEATSSDPALIDFRENADGELEFPTPSEVEQGPAFYGQETVDTGPLTDREKAIMDAVQEDKPWHSFITGPPGPTESFFGDVAYGVRDVSAYGASGAADILKAPIVAPYQLTRNFFGKEAAYEAAGGEAGETVRNFGSSAAAVPAWASIGLPAEAINKGGTAADAAEFTGRAIEEEGLTEGLETSGEAAVGATGAYVDRTVEYAQENPAKFAGTIFGSAALLGAGAAGAGSRAGSLRAAAKAELDPRVTAFNDYRGSFSKFLRDESGSLQIGKQRGRGGGDSGGGDTVTIGSGEGETRLGKPGRGPGETPGSGGSNAGNRGGGRRRGGGNRYNVGGSGTRGAGSRKGRGRGGDFSTDRGYGESDIGTKVDVDGDGTLDATILDVTKAGAPVFGDVEPGGLDRETGTQTPGQDTPTQTPGNPTDTDPTTPSDTDTPGPSDMDPPGVADRDADGDVTPTDLDGDGDIDVGAVAPWAKDATKPQVTQEWEGPARATTREMGELRDAAERQTVEFGKVKDLDVVQATAATLTPGQDSELRQAAERRQLDPGEAQRPGLSQGNRAAPPKPTDLDKDLTNTDQDTPQIEAPQQDTPLDQDTPTDLDKPTDFDRPDFDRPRDPRQRDPRDPYDPRDPDIPDRDLDLPDFDDNNARRTQGGSRGGVASDLFDNPVIDPNTAFNFDPFGY